MEAFYLKNLETKCFHDNLGNISVHETLLLNHKRQRFPWQRACTTRVLYWSMGVNGSIIVSTLHHLCGWRKGYEVVFLLFAGDMLRLSRITPQLIIIEPPEKLVIEVQSSGAYDVINWRRNGASYTFNDPDFPISSDRFFYFSEAYVREPTSVDDLGLYEVEVFNAGGQNTQFAPDQFFTVVHYGEFYTSIFASYMHHMESVLTSVP